MLSPVHAAVLLLSMFCCIPQRKMRVWPQGMQISSLDTRSISLCPETSLISLVNFFISMPIMVATNNHSRSILCMHMHQRGLLEFVFVSEKSVCSTSNVNIVCFFAYNARKVCTGICEFSYSYVMKGLANVIICGLTTNGFCTHSEVPVVTQNGKQEV